MDLAKLGKPIFSFETKKLGTLYVNPLYSLTLGERLSLIDPITYPNDSTIRKLISLLCTKTDNHEGYLKRDEVQKISSEDLDIFSKKFSQKGIPKNDNIPQAKPEEQSNIDFLCIQLNSYIEIEKEKHQDSINQFTSNLSFSNSTTDNISKLMADTTLFDRQDILDSFETQDRLADLSKWANSNNSVEWAKLYGENDHDKTQQSFFSSTEPSVFEIPNPIEDTNKSLERVEEALGSMNSFAQEAAIVQVQIANELKKSGDENSNLGSKNFRISFAVLIMTFASLVMAYTSIQGSNKAAQEFSTILKHVDKNLEQTSLATLAISNAFESQPKRNEQQTLINELREESSKNKIQIKKLKATVEQLKAKLQKLTTQN